LDADIDANAMVMIELKLENSKALATRPGPWRRTWDVEYFLKALEEIYAINVVDKFVEDPTLKVFLRACEGLILKWQRATRKSKWTTRTDPSGSGQNRVLTRRVIITIARAAVS